MGIGHGGVGGIMFSFSRAALRVCLSRAVVMFVLMAICTITAHADDDAPLQSSTASSRQSIDMAIEHQKNRRSAAIAGMVVGGIAIISGSIVSIIATVENRSDREDGRPRSHNPYVPYVIGLGVGLPIEGLSAYVFAIAQHRLNLLNDERLSISYSPETHQPVLRIAFSY